MRTTFKAEVKGRATRCSSSSPAASIAAAAAAATKVSTFPRYAAPLRPHYTPPAQALKKLRFRLRLRRNWLLDACQEQPVRLHLALDLAIGPRWVSRPHIVGHVPVVVRHNDGREAIALRQPRNVRQGATREVIHAFGPGSRSVNSGLGDDAIDLIIKVTRCCKRSPLQK